MLRDAIEACDESWKGRVVCDDYQQPFHPCEEHFLYARMSP